MNQIKNILYLGWLGKGNVGDEVLYELFKLMFYKYYKSKNKDLVVNIDTFTALNGYRVDVSTYDLIVLGGGSLIQIPSFLQVCQDGIKAGIPVISWGTGVDGAYSPEQLDSIHIAGESVQEIIALFEQFKYISVRGPFAKNILINSGLKNKVHEIGDPALSYSVEMFDDKVGNNLKDKRILVNWGTSYNNIFGGNELAVENELVMVIKELLSQDYKVTVYPIWTEDIEPVKRLVKKINDNRCEIITEVYEAKVLQRFISEAYLTINLKLHANILSASTNRPFISLAYRGKCFDFAQTVDCMEYAVSTSSVTASDISKMVKDIEGNYDSIVERLITAKEKYYPRLLDSFDKISTILNKQSFKETEVEIIDNDLMYIKYNETSSNKKLSVENTNFQKIIRMSYDLSETILEGLNYTNILLEKDQFEQSIPMMNNIFDAFDSVKKAVDSIKEQLGSCKILEKIELLQESLEEVLSAYEQFDIVKIRDIIKPSLEHKVKELRNDFRYLLLN